MFRTPDSNLEDWIKRKRAIEEIEGSEGYKIILARIQQELTDAEEKLTSTWRWNWFRILRLLIQRDTAQSYLNYIEGVKKVGSVAEKDLLQRDPEALKKMKRPSFMSNTLHN